jgi:hypothetical protein
MSSQPSTLYRLPVVRSNLQIKQIVDFIGGAFNFLNFDLGP